MSNSKLRGKDLRKINFASNKAISVALQIMGKHYKYITKDEQLQLLQKIKENPTEYIEDEILKKIALEFVEVVKDEVKKIHRIDSEPKPYKIFGKQFIDQNTIRQMDTAMQLPVAVKGALMPDAHLGYGLPVGGVLATENAIIPYAVGLDIGCRMSLTLFEQSPEYMHRYHYQFKTALDKHSYFGIGKKTNTITEHAVLDRYEFREIELLKQVHSKSKGQLGTSGSGNHFVEFGEVVLESDNTLGVPEGNYVGLLSHSGSRGLGATIANYYTRVAIDTCKLPKGYQHLAWLDMNSHAGQEYWMSMNLAGDYAKACHDVIHMLIAKELKLTSVLTVENHHNFAWKEAQEDGKELLVHRKGATPAGLGIKGIIPGSMTAPGYIVSGKGNASSVHSAAHGAGRKMSRQKARAAITGNEMKKRLRQCGVTLIGGGVDEAPMAYKNLNETIVSQNELVKIEGIFEPKIVKMDRN